MLLFNNTFQLVKSFFSNAAATVVPIYGFGSTVSRLQSHYYERGCFLPLSPQEFLVLIWSTFKGWRSSKGQGIQCLNKNHLKDIKKPKTLGLCPWKTQQGSTLDPKMQLQSLRNCLFPYKTQSYSLKWTLVKVLG